MRLVATSAGGRRRCWRCWTRDLGARYILECPLFTTGMAPNRQDLEARIDTLERRQEDLLQIVAELQAIAPIDMDDTPMSITDAKT